MYIYYILFDSIAKIKFPTGTKLAQPNPSEKNPTKPENSIVLPFDACKL